MGRVMDGPAPGERSEYIPDVSFDDWKNREDPEPVRVWVTNPSRSALRRVHAAQGAQRVDMDADGNVISVDVDEHEQDDRMRRVLEAFVESVENYKAYGKQIKTGADLWEFGEPAFVYDVAGHIMGMLSIPKKTKPSSAEHTDSSPPTTTLSVGTASNAA